jgi:hypothetical protein
MAQHDGQAQIGRHRLGRAQQGTKPALGAQHLLRPVDQLGQEFLKLELGDLREDKSRGVYVGFGRASCSRGLRWLRHA